MNFLTNGKSSRIDTAVKWWMIVRLSVFGSILFSAMTIYDLPIAEPSPYSVLLSISLLSILVGVLLAKFRVDRSAQLAFHATVDLFAISALVFLTGAGTSPFSFLYVFVVAATGALLSLGGGIMSGIVASVLYGLAVIVGPMIRIKGLEPVIIALEPIEWEMALIDVGLHGALYLFVGLINGLLSRKLHFAARTLSQLEDELKRLKLETKDILRNIGSGIFTCDLKERILYMNPSAKKILGVENEDVVGKPLSFLLQERSPDFYRYVKKSLSGSHGPQRPFEFFLGSRDGRMAIVGASTSPLRDRAAEKKGVTVICQDISEKRELERLSQKAQKMELMADVSTMLAKEIVPSIDMVKKSLQMCASGGFREDNDRIISDALEQLETIGSVLWDFQNFSRIKVADWKPVLVGDVVRDTVSLLRHHPEFSNAVQIKLMGKEMSTLIWGDRELLKQAFMHLFIQSCKKMGRKGLIEVEFYPPIDPEAGEPVNGNGHHLIVNLQENAKAVVEEDLDYLGPSLAPALFSGNGMRVAIVDKIVRAHTGEFLQEEIEGKGTKYTVMLPLSRPPQPGEQ